MEILIVKTCMAGLQIEKLTAVYCESISAEGKKLYPDVSEVRQISLAETRFQTFLREDFFPEMGTYCIWEKSGVYVSALRLWKYPDGFLLEGLETAPEFRKQGFASHLIAAVQQNCAPGTVLFSHVDRKNAVSMSIHEKLGFQIIRQSARCLNGEISSRLVTFSWKKQENDDLTTKPALRLFPPKNIF